MHGYAHSSIIV